ncbi:MAG: cytochrome ubiquinol oxidase subunit I [Opitutales bacterium]|nr:cytochrome ubiquinol oxidase subunit I [Opitutales bacterium]
MDAALLARLQFGLTAAFHYIYPPISIGLGVCLVIMETMWLKTRNEHYRAMTRFWAKVFGLTFAIGVASGIVLEFEFGTNWEKYSRFVGDVFGSALAAEGIFAFFLESGFLAIVLFGWRRVSPLVHWLSTVIVCLGAHFSALWIVIANSWMQTPAGHHIVEGPNGPRAEILDFWAMVFNPSSIMRLSHTLLGAWQSGAFLLISVGAWYLLKKRDVAFAKSSIKVGLAVATVATLLSLWTGSKSAEIVAEYQPSKLAAMEGHFDSKAPADMYILGWVDEENNRTIGIKVKGMLSWLIHGDSSVPVRGLDSYAQEDRPPLNLTFQGYHIMISIGMASIGISLLGLWGWKRGWLWSWKPFLWVMVLSSILPQLGNQVGWLTAEVGRQPWIVWELMRTSDGLSTVVSAEHIMISLILFALVYLLLFAVFVYMFNHKVHHGPEDVHSDEYANSRLAMEAMDKRLSRKNND